MKFHIFLTKTNDFSYWNKLCIKQPQPCLKNYQLTDEHPELDDYTRYGYVKTLSPCGFSTNSVLHFAQLIAADQKNPVFKKFDWGSARANKKYYGQDQPPVYDLSLIKEKVRILSGTGDKLADTKDVQLLVKKLVNADLKVNVIPNWGHLTFTLGKDMAVVYGKLIQQLDKDLKIDEEEE